MKLIIQIPCYNEEKTLPVTLKSLPSRMSGIDKIEYLIIDDGSNDNTVKVAKRLRVHHIIVHNKNLGLAKAFSTGINECLRLGADIIVNTDADNQYCADDIKKLIIPILEKKADIVVGARPIEKLKHFSTTKKILQRLGSWVVRVVSRTDIPDPTCGFRAISREAAYRINVFTGYTYTLETIIQAGQENINITSIPIRVNDNLRPSRLIKNIPLYIGHSIATILRIFMTYKPLRFFMLIGLIFFTAGLALGIRYLYFLSVGGAGGHVQSLILAAIFLIVGFLFGMMGLLGDLVSINRRLLEDVQYKVHKYIYNKKKNIR
jgi:glycosyltransferase involved in cell wall biosynthesis